MHGVVVASVGATRGRVAVRGYDDEVTALVVASSQHGAGQAVVAASRGEPSVARAEAAMANHTQQRTHVRPAQRRRCLS